MTEPFVIIVWQIFTKMKHAVPYGLAITHMGIYPREIKIYAHTKICRKKNIFAVPSFIKNRDREQLRSLSADKWLFILCTFKPLKIMRQLKERHKCLEVSIISRNFCLMKKIPTLNKLHNAVGQWFYTLCWRELLICPSHLTPK